MEMAPYVLPQSGTHDNMLMFRHYTAEMLRIAGEHMKHSS
jgi:hypothetical protein